MKMKSMLILSLILMLSLAVSVADPPPAAAEISPPVDRALEAGGEILTAADFFTDRGPNFDGGADEDRLTAADFPINGPPEQDHHSLSVDPADPIASLDGAAIPVSDVSSCRTVTADVVALDQPFFYNRLGAINANGMMYALARDVVVQDNTLITPDVTAFNNLTLPEFEAAGGNRADLKGQVSLRADKRPRPIVLRMNEGDCLAINFTNLLDPNMFIFNLGEPLNPVPLDNPFPTGQILGLGVPIGAEIDNQPLTRLASIHVDGLALVNDMGDDGSNVGQNGAAGNGLVAPGGSTTYTYYAAHEATHLLYSMGSTIGAEGGGGTRAYGLFGALNVQKGDAEWYRSQLTREEMDLASCPRIAGPLSPCQVDGTTGDPVINMTPAGQPKLNYDALYPTGTGGGKDGLPIVNMLTAGNEIVHSDINAIITGPGRGKFPPGTYRPNGAAGDPKNLPPTADSVRNEPYREFTVIFHDEGFTVQAFPAFYNDPVLKHTLHSVRDSFPINYGSGGIGSEIVANRLGVGPMWDCAECKYEEFFLTSWTVGDPAMIVDIPANTGVDGPNPWLGPKATKALYPDDPSNVHHSYLSDRVKFRNLHAGPKEHHVFHLHAHQWLFNPDDPQSNYLDGQAIGPGSGYTYEIAYGGSGNRNKTAGDSIFHCHFYPHFAQGMWEMWRVHDTFEQGTLMAPDPADPTGPMIPAPGSRALPDGEIVAGTPIPGVVPIPTNPMAPMPDAAATIVASDLDGDGNNDSSQFDANGDNTADIEQVGNLFAEVPIQNELASVDVGTSTGGTFTLIVDGNPTTPIAFDAPAFGPGSVEEALNGLANVSVTVSGTGTTVDPWVITFSEYLGQFDVPDLTGDGTNLTGGGTLTTLVTTQGVGRPLINPGYPWYIPGLLGHRPPTPALDLLDDGGLKRHVVTSGPDLNRDGVIDPNTEVETIVSRLDFNKVLHGASAVQIPEDGTAVEQVAMNFHATQFHDSYLPNGDPATNNNGFETNGLPPVPGAPYADPCRAFSGAGPWTLDYPNGTVRTIKGANIEMPIVLNKVGWHFQQQRFEALWEDVVPTLNEDRAPQPMIMRLNSTDCAEFHHANLVPNVYQLDDYQVRTPTDIIGQHIHLVKFDVMSADGSANGWNYEDGTLSPDEVRERIYAFNHGGGFEQTDGTVRSTANGNELEAATHPYFGDGPDNNNDGVADWLGARTTIQRWYADPLLERSWDGGVGTVFTHDHYGPSTHQQVGLYSTLLVEPKGSVWRHNETGTLLGVRVDDQGSPLPDFNQDGGPSGWQAIIEPGPGGVDFEPHREFYFEFADFQHAYEAGGGVLHQQNNEAIIGPSKDIPSYADFDDAINPSFRLPPPNRADIFFHPNGCPGPDVGQVNLARPCPEAISADDPGTYALNFRNEPIGLRVFNGQLGPGAGQTPGQAGDLAFAYQSRTDRAIAALNSQPAGPYPPLTNDVQPGDPWTPMLRVYMGDKVRIRVQVGAHEEEHNFTLPGLKWKQEPNSPNSGWKNSEFFGIDEYFNLDVPIVPDTESGTPAKVDYVYTVGAELEGMWNGVWGIMRSYGSERNDLYELPNNNVGKNGYAITNEAEFNGICPVTAPLRTFNITAVRAVDVLDGRGLVYNDRTTALIAPPDGVNGVGPLIDPTALIYVRNEDLGPDGKLVGEAEPLILRVNAGDCIQVNLTNALPADLGATEMDGFNALPPIVHKNENVNGIGGAGGITSFNANDITPSSYVGLTPQLLAFDPRTDGGFSTGLTTGKLVAPGDSGTYTWYAGDVTVVNAGVQGNKTKFTLSTSPVEFGAVGLMPADRIKGNENGLVGAMVVEPQESCWITDPGTRAQATVWKGAGLSGECTGTQTGTGSYRDFVTVMQNDVNLRYGGGACDPEAESTQIASMDCAVPSIAAEGPLGPPEDPQDTGQKAVNYGADPLWFRLGITPDTKFGQIHRDQNLKDDIPNVFANCLINGDCNDPANFPGEDPQTEVYRASPGGPDYGRFRVVMPGGHARGTTYTLHGHEWQRQPYINGSAELGNNPISEYYGTQEGVNPTGHWDFVTKLGGYGPVTGDYLWRDQASFGSYQGLWGLLRFDQTAPVAADAAASTPKYICDAAGANCVAGSVDIDLLALALDLDGDATAVTIISDSGPSLGTANVVDGTATYTFDPPAGFNWQASCLDEFSCLDSFTYTVTDVTNRTSNEATVTITVLNTAPVANHDTAVIDGAPTQTIDIPVLANDTDAEGDLDMTRIPTPNPAPEVAIGSQPVDRFGTAAGTVIVLDGAVQYTEPAPAPDPFSGVARFPYTVTDESGAVSNEAIVRVAIRVDNVVINRAQYQPSNQRWSISGTCSEPEKTITIYFGDSTAILPPDNMIIGTVVCAPDNTWGFSGPSENPANTTPESDTQNFVSILSSGGGFYDGFPVSFAGQNNVPVAVEDPYTIDEDEILNDNVLLNDIDADFDPLTAVLVSDVLNGTLALNADGSFTYTPNENYNGADSFQYLANDGKADSNVVTNTITINAVNDAPVAVDNAYSTSQDTPLTVAVPGVLDNDTDAENEPLTVSAVNGVPADVGVEITLPSGASLTLNANGSFDYTPVAGSNNTDSFTYLASDGQADSNEATVTISVGAVNQPPVAVDDAFVTDQNIPVVGNVLADNGNGADFDPNNNPLTVSAVNGVAADVGVEITLASGATLTLNVDGSFTYTPLFNFTGPDSFTYVANDGTVDSNPATVTISVIDTVTVTDATYRARQDRWRIQGTVSDADNSVDVYLCRAADQPDPTNNQCEVRELLGAANVNNIDGTWNFQDSSPATTSNPPLDQVDSVIAVSSVGGVSNTFPVTVRQGGNNN